jgi:two-component system cell cycle sensor histidine kinase PleC
MTRPANDGLPRPQQGDSAEASPSFIVDVAAGAIVAANAAGRALWGLDAAAASATVAIDRAMPALQRLAGLAHSCGDELLTFWTAKGAVAIACRVEPVGTDGGRYLVSAGVEAQAPKEALPVPARSEATQPTPAAARLAHELRTPLSAVIAYAEVLKDEHFGPLANPRYREYARTIYDSARHALCVVDGMLAGKSVRAGLPELAFRDLDPADVIENCLAVAGPLAERAGLHLAADLGHGTPHIVADEVSLKQMLLNLITNAIKFGRRGDRVTVRAAYGSDGAFAIDVADTGPGMGAEAVTGTEAAPAAGRSSDAGLGIGLPLTRALAKANGAALTVDSAPGCGTRVTIAFGKDRVVPV